MSPDRFVPPQPGEPRIPVAILGATGTVGQRFITLLEHHPWFEIQSLCASPRSAGKHYRDAVQWIQNVPLSDQVASTVVEDASRASLGEIEAAAQCPLVFSALDAGPATEIEAAFAERGHLVVSNARSYRMAPGVPLLVPEVNADHLAMTARHHEAHRGAIIANPNCSTIGLVLALAPLERAFGVEAVHVVTMQALSGAGLPGVSAYAIQDNVVPFIPGEEEKLEIEPHKILGAVNGDRSDIVPAQMVVSAQTNRVPVVDGHTLCVSVSLREKAGAEDVRRAWREFRGEPQKLSLPTAPDQPIHDLGDLAPQPRLHRDLDRGMATTVGRLRECPLLDWRFVALSHNTLRGAAGGALLGAEMAVARGLLPDLAKTRPQEQHA